MRREVPPQTVGEALDLGWSALAFECARRSCGHEGHIDLETLPRRRLLAAIIARGVCGRCRARPSNVYLAVRIGPEAWRRKELDLLDG